MIRGITALIICLSICAEPAQAQEGRPVPEEGILYLREHIIDQSTIMNLNGEWEFFWDKLLEPEDFKTGQPPVPDCFPVVPSYWNGYTVNGKELPGQGHGTYRLRIILPEYRPSNIMFDLPVFDVSYKVYLNDIMAGMSGVTGTSKEDSEPGYNPKLTMYSVDSDTLQVLVQVSNYYHRRGGFWKSVRMGGTTKLVQLNNRYELISYLSLGVLLAFSLFFLSFFAFYRKDYITLFFALALFGIFARLATTDIYPAKLFFNLPWKCMIRVEYLGTFLAFVAGSWYFYSIYPSKIVRKINYGNTFLCIAIGLFIWLTDVDVFAYTMLYFQPAVVVMMLYYLVVSSYKSIRRKKWQDIVYFLSIIVFVGALINDMMIANSQTALTKGYTVHFAMQIFVFAQAVMIIKSWVNTYIEKERLNKEIEDININLEKRVSERTEELNIRNRELEDALHFKDRVFSIIAHDLKSPIASLIQNSELINDDEPFENRRAIFSSFKELAQSAGDLIDNLLYWGRSQGDQIAFRPEVCDLAEIVQENLKLFNEGSKQKAISLNLQTIPESTAYCDKELIHIVLRNLISNALKYSHRGGKVILKIFNKPEAGEQLFISVEDNGIGMTESFREKLFGEEEITTTPGTEMEKGTGLGLKLCYDLVRINQGNIEVKSEPGKGTEFIIDLPARAKQ
ncbi:MAG: sensor histidine kinase [Bacteroidales bacterium]|nr:sensor histidine kinase [Bacteroidales bacterium]